MATALQMDGRTVRARHARMLPWLCIALVLLPDAAIGLRPLHSSGSFHGDGEQSSRLLLQPRHLAEVEALEPEAEVVAPGGLKQMVLGGGIKRLGIHGEGLGFAHALLESDAEVMALAAAMKTGNVFAEGHGLKKEAGGDEAETENDSAGSPTADGAPRKPDRIKKLAEKLAEAARSRDRPAEDGAAEDSGAEGTPGAAVDTAEDPSQAAEPDQAAPEVPAAAVKEETAAREADALPPWFSRKTAAAVAEIGRRPSEHSHGSGRHSTRRARHNSMEDTWLQVHQRYLKEVTDADGRGGWDVLFYGDSIVEEWRGTFLGAPWGPFHEVRKVWDEFFGRKPYTAHSLGIASDGVEQLKWRLQHGELPTDKDRHPKVLVLHVGTNDIVGECTNELGIKVAARIEDVVTDLHQRLPATHLIVMAILPKGEVWPNRCSGAIDTANEALQSLAQSRSDHLHFMDAGQAFLSESLDKNKFEIRETLMPDSMHPSAVGMRMIANRLEPLVSRLVASPLQTGPKAQRR